MVEVFLLKLSNDRYLFNEFPKSADYLNEIEDKDLIKKIIDETKGIINNTQKVLDETKGIINNTQKVLEFNKKANYSPQTIEEISSTDFSKVPKSIFKVIDITNHLRSVNINNSDQEMLSADFSVVLPIEDNFNNEFITLNGYNVYINDFFIIKLNNKEVFYGFVDSISISATVDSNVICNIRLYSYTKLLKTSSFVVSEALLNKIYTDFNNNENQIKTSKEFFANIQNLTVWSDIFQDKTVMEIIRYILKYKLFCTDTLNFNFENFLNTSSKYLEQNMVIPSFYVLFCMHYVKNGFNIIQTDMDIHIKPYLNLLSNGIPMTDSIYKTPYDVIGDVCNNLLLEFFEDFGNTLIIREKYYFNKNQQLDEKIKQEKSKIIREEYYFNKNQPIYPKIGILNYLSGVEISNYNNYNSNIFVTTFVEDLIGQLSEYINGVFYDHLSIYKNNFIYNNETYVSPYNRSYGSLSAISKYKYKIGLAENSSSFNLSFLFPIDYEFELCSPNKIYHLFGDTIYLSKYNIFIYPKNVSISINVDENIGYSLSGSVFCFDPALFEMLNKIMNFFYSKNFIYNSEQISTNNPASKEFISMVKGFINKNGLSIFINSDKIFMKVLEEYKGFKISVNKNVAPFFTALTRIDLKENNIKKLKELYKDFLNKKIILSVGDEVVLDKTISNPEKANDSKDVTFYHNKIVLNKTYETTIEEYLKGVFFVERNNVTMKDEYVSLFYKIDTDFRQILVTNEISYDSFKEDLFYKIKKRNIFKNERIELIDLINQLINVTNEKKDSGNKIKKDITKR